MMIDKKRFEIVEQMLIEQGIIEAFEQENGAILGRMMITIDTMPEELAEEVEIKDDLTVFTASFDFYDMTVSAAVYTQSKEVAKMWMTPQGDDIDQPAREWISFFIKKMFEGIKDDGSYGVPVYSFVNNTSDLTIIPTV